MCKFCNKIQNNKDYRFVVASSSDGLTDLFVERDNGLFLLAIGESMSEKIPLHFCPVCGANLDSENIESLLK